MKPVLSTKFLSKKAQVKAKVALAAAPALKVGAEAMLEYANRTIPHEEGILQDSGNTNVEGSEAVVYYDTAYAARQHEETSWKHSPGRRAKWLEMSYNERGRAILNLIGLQLRRILG